jgi:hypothetical protein
MRSVAHFVKYIITFIVYFSTRLAFPAEFLDLCAQRMPERILCLLQFTDNSPRFSELEFGGSLSIDDPQESKELRSRSLRRDRKGRAPNPDWELLGGPCVRCGDYYLKRARRRTKYCSRKCSSKETAISSTRSWRADQQERKISRAQECIDEWCNVKRREAWKTWVSRKTGFTDRWLTRAEHNGKINPPSSPPKWSNYREQQDTGVER